MIMKHILKFKSFKEANNYMLNNFCKSKFNIKKFKSFIKEYSNNSKNPYKPGLLKFKSFKEAREFDIKQLIKFKR